MRFPGSPLTPLSSPAKAQEEIAQLHQELLRSKRTSSPRSSVMAQNILRRVEAERDEAAADLRRMTMERDSLRERLKVDQTTGMGGAV